MMCNCEIIETLAAKLKEEETELVLAQHTFDSRITEHIQRRVVKLKERLKTLEPCEVDCKHKQIRQAEINRKTKAEERLQAIESALNILVDLSIEDRLIDIENALGGNRFDNIEKDIKTLAKASEIQKSTHDKAKVLLEGSDG